jgi:hypothetical protein
MARPAARTSTQEITMPNPQVPDRIKEAPAVVLRAIFAGIGQLLMAADKVWAQVQEQISSQQPTQSAPPSPQAHQNTKAPETSQTSQRPQTRRRNANEAGNVTLLRDESAPGKRREQPSAGWPAAERNPAPVVTHPAAARSAPAAPKPATAPAAPAPPAPAPAAEKPAELAATSRPTPAPEQAAPATAKTTTPKPAPAASKPAAARKPTATPKPAPAARKPAAARKPTATPKPAPAASKPAAPAATDRSAPPIAGYDDLSVASLRARLRVLDASAVQALLDYEKAHERRDEVITMFERRLIKIVDKAG